MIFTSASLPLARKHLSDHRRVGFEDDEGGVWKKFKDKVIAIVHAAIRAPTGSPSDGLGGDGTESSTSTSAFVAAQKQIIAEKDGEDWEINEVVINGDNGDALHNERDTATGSPFRSDSGGSIQRSSLVGDGEHGYMYHPPSLRSKIRWYSVQVMSFFNQRFDEEEREIDFRKLRWYSNKAWAFYGSLFLVLNWILYLALNLDSTKRTLYGQLIYYVGLTILTVPIPFFIAADMPVHHPVPFQIWMTAAVWYCGITETIEMRLCDFFSRPNTCFGKDFLAEMFYSTALPTIMMFVLTDRLYNAIAAVIELVLLLVFVIPVQGIYARNVISFILFTMFAQGLHYNREVTERRLYLLNAQLKLAYKAQQKAQNAQFRASQAKRRFASYIFHEVRVPLNNAAIAFNNMTTHDMFREQFLREQGVMEDVAALDVSLATVQQVLNDSLDLEKMDAGHFDINPRPFCLHRVIRSTLGPITVSAAAKGLDVHIDLDAHIDRIRPSADPLANANGNSEKAIEDGNGHGELRETWVVGDEVRLRQVLTNLASNAVKFTPEGTKAGITVHTKLMERRVYPSRNSSGNGNGGGNGNASAHGLGRYPPGLERKHTNGSEVDLEKGEEDGYEHEHEHEEEKKQDMIVFRLEITDSGPGIKPSDLVDNHLFQPFAQTKVGRLSKNSTGLGLAIVRQIVSLSGGRLGVQSQRGKGATFWIELAYPLANTPEVEAAVLRENRRGQPPMFATASTIAEVKRWPAVAFADDVKLPMLSGAVAHPPPMLSVEYTPPTPPLIAASSSYLSTTSTLPTPPILRLGSDAPLLAEARTLNELVHEEEEATKKASELSNPLSSDGTTSSTQSVPAPANEADDPLVVLVVDDNNITRSTMARALKKRGCVVYTAQDGKECLDLVMGPNSRTYDLISLDNDMPVMTGEDAVKAMREAGRHDVFVVGCTGNALTDDQKRYLDAGADDVLIKPLDFQRLSEIMEIARTKRRQRRKPES